MQPTSTKSLKFRRVPWMNKGEWMTVYEKVTGGPNHEAFVTAVAQMDTWINRENCPPAVEYTCRFLQPMVMDPFFFPGIADGESESNLRTQYATSLLRFINILGEIDSVKSLSLNARALKLGLPEWVVNTRHQISHGSSLPSLDVLRVSVKSLLSWLTENYWLVEKEAMEDVMLVDSVALAEKKFGALLRIYAYLETQRGKVEVRLVRDIKDKKIMEDVKDINNKMYHAYKMESSPWDAHSLPGLNLKIEAKKLQKLPVSKLLSKVVRSIKLYCEHEADVVMKLLVQNMLQEDQNNELGFYLWEPLIVALHSKDKLLAIVDCLYSEMNRENSASPRRAQEWVLFLLNSLSKRSRVERKLQNLSSTSEPVTKRMKLTLNEKQRKLLTKERIKLQLSQGAGAGNSKLDKLDILFGLFEVVERQNPSLKEAFRLQEAKFFSEADLRRFLLLTFTCPVFSLPIAETLVKLSDGISTSQLQKMIKVLNLKHDVNEPRFVDNSPTVDVVSLNNCLRA